ncbi:MAG: heme ABC transporter ATP-binding protein [Desulfobacteraceae bacterium]|nr:heme ABC transporter ATP-binding protein [Desulfobacteraceae bacterium]
MSPSVALREVRFAYGRQAVIENLSLEIAEGDFFAVIGPNGSGKTTLLRLILGSLSAQAGDIAVFGRPLAGYSRRELARRIALVPQGSVPVFSFAVEEIVRMGRAPHLGLLGFDAAEDIDEAARAIAAVGLGALARRPLDQLSGGEQQRVWIARALCQQPRLMLLDEPTAALDMGHQLQIMRLLARLRRERKMTVVMVSHDLNLAAMFATRMLLLHGGGAVCTGTPQEVLQPAHIRTAYGCEVLVDRHPQGDFPRLTLPVDPTAGNENPM